MELVEGVPITEQIKVVHHPYPEVRRLGFSPDVSLLAAVTYRVRVLGEES